MGRKFKSNDFTFLMFENPSAGSKVMGTLIPSEDS